MKLAVLLSSALVAALVAVPAHARKLSPAPSPTPNPEFLLLSDFEPVVHDWTKLEMDDVRDALSEVFQGSMMGLGRGNLREHSLAGPLIGGGGGEGLACFATREEADSALDHDGRLTNEARRRVTHVMSIDAIERPTLPPHPGENTAQFIQRVVDSTALHSPYFAWRLKQAVALVTAGGRGVEKWQPRGALPKLHDAGMRLGLRHEELAQFGLHCRVIQLAIRYEVKGPSPFPRVFIDYDKELFDRLGHYENLGRHSVSKRQNVVHHQAALILHEAVWLMGSMIGEKSSSDARLIVSTLLTFDPVLEQLNSSTTNLKERANTLSILLRTYGFERHGWAFLDMRRAPTPHSKLSRQRAHARLEEKLYRIVDPLLDKPTTGLSWTKHFFVKAEDVHSIIRAIAPLVNDEEAFLYLSTLAHFSGSTSYGRDHFLLPNVDDTLGGQKNCSLFKGNLRADTSSRKSPTIRDAVPDMQTLLAKAVGYCEKARW